MNQEEIKSTLEKYYKMDMHYEEGKILGSMYTTPPGIVLETFFKFYQSNLGNSGLYPGTSLIEKEVIKFLLKLTSGKNGFYGHILSGGTEANITALWAARELGYKRILTTKDAHFSIIKASKLLNIPIKYINKTNGKMNIESLTENIADGDIVVATAGTTPLGYIDPIEEIGEICENYKCFLHVDAAFGGYVIPFLRELGFLNKKFGFDIDTVRTITIDPHKMGFAPYPAGGLVARDNVFKIISVEAPYLMSGESDTLLGTRQSGSVAAAYAAQLYFGWDGYKNIVKKCMEITNFTIKIAEEMDLKIFGKPETNIVNIKTANPVKTKRYLVNKGWGISINPQYKTVRLVLMPHIYESTIESFLKDFKNIEKRL